MMVFLLLACTTALPPRGDCNPVDDGHCLLPFPSNFFVDDEALAFGPASLPINRDGVLLGPDAWNRLDGFPTLGALYAHLPGASLEGAATHQDIERSLQADSPTLIIDAQTRELVPHFAEREVQAPEDRQALVLRPVLPLEHGRRYIVAIRALQGGVAPEGFAAIRDGDGDLEPDLERQVETYEEIFGILGELGVEREDLLLAWDFQTVSEEVSLRDMRHIRDEGLAWGDPDYSVESVVEGDCGSGDPIARTLRGEMTVPLYLDSWEPGSRLERDATGLPAQNGSAQVPFVVHLPCSLVEDPHAGALVQFGHGVLGDHDESASLVQLANDYGWVLFGVSWTGMKKADISAITLMLANDATGFSIIPDRLHQGHLEFMLAARMMQGPMVEDPLLQQEGQALIDPDRLYFYGVSQGGILGGAQVAMSPDIDRAVLCVPGTPFGLILTRSQNFQPFLRLLEAKYSDWMDISLLMGLMQMLWDPTESAGWAGLQDKDVLIQSAIGDASVTTLSAQVMARSYGALLMEPSVRPVWGLDSMEPPFEGSALVEFDWGSEEPFEAVPADLETDTHGGPGGSPEARAQVGGFFQDGLVYNPCEGSCDPR